MDTSFVEVLVRRARTLLPPATVMAMECAADGGDERMATLLEEVQQKGLRGEPLCPEPGEAVIFADRVLLRCGGCPRAKELPRLAGIGRGRTEAEARQNALYALTLPLDRANARRAGCFRAQRWGEGPVEAVEYACIFSRVAYARVSALRGG